MMVMPVACIQCDMQAEGLSLELQALEVNSKGIYEFECRNGHKVVCVVQQLLFELLFEVGMHAIVDGYYREAISTFTASLERFYEFSVRVILRATERQLLIDRSLDAESSIDLLMNDCWKAVASQSERQLGAFVFSWALHFGAKPAILSPKAVERRNEVIHRGEIPNRAQAIEFGQGVLDIIRPQMLRLNSELGEDVRIQVMKSMPRPTVPSSTMVVPTLLSVSVPPTEIPHHSQTVEEYLKLLMDRRIKAGW